MSIKEPQAAIEEQMPRKKRGASAPKSPVDIDVAITADDVQRVIANYVLPTSKQLRVPTDDAAAELAAILTRWKILIHRNNADRKEWALMQNTTAKADELNHLLVELLGHVEPRVKEDPSTPLGEENITRIREAIAAVSKISSGLILLPIANPEKINGWSWLAGVLPLDFERAMQSTNPNAKFGIGKDGPVVRFVAAIAPAITGEHPPLASVTRQLKAARKKPSLEINGGEKCDS